MARVIAHPSPDDEIKIVCPHCRFKIAYVPNDVVAREHKDYGGGSDTYYWLKCPNCAKEIEVGRP